MTAGIGDLSGAKRGLREGCGSTFMKKPDLRITQSQIARIAVKLGVFGQKNREVFCRIADELGVRHPTSKQDGRALAARYLALKCGGKLPARKGGRKRYEATDAFLSSFEWRRLRMQVLVKRGAVCECCGASVKKDGIRVNVDHIKPRRDFPELALDESNLQVLCESCNHGKGNWDRTDWRADSEVPRIEAEHRPLWG